MSVILGIAHGKDKAEEGQTLDGFCCSSMFRNLVSHLYRKEIKLKKKNYTHRKVNITLTRVKFVLRFGNMRYGYISYRTVVTLGYGDKSIG